MAALTSAAIRRLRCAGGPGCSALRVASTIAPWIFGRAIHSSGNQKRIVAVIATGSGNPAVRAQPDTYEPWYR
jgi:hypothetical protein